MRRRILKDSEWIAWLWALYTAVSKNKTAWGIPDALLQQLSILANAARSAYNENSNPGTKNHATAAAKDEAFERVKEFLVTFLPSLIANDKIGNEELEAIGLHTRRVVRASALSRPPHAPELEVIAGKQHELDAYASIPRLGQSTSRLKEHEEYALFLRYKREDETTWSEKYSSRMHVRLVFGEEHVGKSVTVTAAWVNPRFEHGPWSAQVTAIIN
jgi:hypothetical protein